MALLKKSTISLSEQDQNFINVMQVLSDPTRFKIFKLLSSGEEMSVSEIARAVEVSVPAASQHFRIFELLGIITKERHGQKIHNQLRSKDPLVKALIKLSNSVNN